MLLELTHVFLFDVCWILALLLTFRFSVPSPIALMSLRIGLILVLAEDLIGLAAAGFSISVAPSWSNGAGTIGALLICLALFRLLPLVWAGRGNGRGLRDRNRDVAVDTWII